MRLAVVGGRLQGTEAAYLARKAGWEVALVDRDGEAPARGLCDTFHRAEITREKDLDRLLRGVGLVIPALENDTVLSILHRWARESGIPLAYDPAAYAVSSSKTRSNELFRENGVPYPRPWPECAFPVIAKASRGSGSENVHRITGLAGLQELQAHPEVEWVIQEWAEGPSFSLEVLGTGTGEGRVFQVTELEMDAAYDCKRVVAPAALEPARAQEFAQITLNICRALNLFGIMDVEIILAGDAIKVLEIDARLPSQTPAAVYHSTGINLVELLGKLTVHPGTDLRSFPVSGEKGVIYEQIRVTAGTLEVCGEHIMTAYGPLFAIPGFFGADEAVTSYAPGRTEWAAILMVTGKDRREAWGRRKEVINAIMKHCRLSRYLDPYPPEGFPSLLPAD